MGVSIEQYRTGLAHLVHVEVESLDDKFAAQQASRDVAPDEAAGHRQLLRRVRDSLEKLEQREASLHEQRATHATDYEKVTALDAELRSTTAEREATEHAWLELAERLGDA